MRRSLLVGVALLGLVPAAPARADLLWGVHVGGGLEGFPQGGQVPRPDGVAEAGMVVEYLREGRKVGIAATVEAVGRLTPQFDDAEEIKVDVMARWASPDRRFRAGVGVGVRSMTLADGQTVRGYDAIRADLTAVLARWRFTARAPVLQIEAYTGWTFGFYRDSYATPPVGDMAPVEHDLRAMTTTYVAGLRSTVSWR